MTERKTIKDNEKMSRDKKVHINGVLNLVTLISPCKTEYFVGKVL